MYRPETRGVVTPSGCAVAMGHSKPAGQLPEHAGCFCSAVRSLPTSPCALTAWDSPDRARL
eukprot:2411161-Prymnesium_polylepis.1